MSPEQVMLRPWRDADTALALPLVDAELTRWFGVEPLPPHALALTDPRWLHGYPPDQSAIFAVVDVITQELVGQVAVRLLGDGVGELSWAVLEPSRRKGFGRMAVDGVLSWCFAAANLARVQAFIEPANEASRRTARACGLRYEGVLRAHETVGGIRRDMACHAILATDSREDSVRRWGAMRAELPRRVLSCAVLLRDDADRVLVLQTTYKADWTLPGGVVEAGEGLRTAALREVREELGVDLPIGPLVLVDTWAAAGESPPVTHAIFDGGRQDPAISRNFTFPDGEVMAAHWLEAGVAAQRCGPRLATRLTRLLEAYETGQLPGPTLHLTAGAPESA